MHFFSSTSEQLDKGNKIQRKTIVFMGILSKYVLPHPGHRFIVQKKTVVRKPPEKPLYF